MARRPRFRFPGLPQHLIQRGNNRQIAFFASVWAHSAEQRQLAYQELFRAELSRIELEQIRTTVNQGWPLGSDRFKNEIEQALGRAASPPKRGRPADSTTDQPAGEGGRLT